MKCSIESQLIPLTVVPLLFVEADANNEEFIEGAIIHAKAKVRPINIIIKSPTPILIHFFVLLFIWKINVRYNLEHIILQVYKVRSIVRKSYVNGRMI
jgi:hypothetical protein